MTVVRRLPAVVIVAVLALLPLQAWLQASRPDVRYSRPIGELDGITWAATVSQDGQLAVTIVYDLDDEPRESSIRLPSGGRFARADGVAISTESGRYGEVQSNGPLTVTYERVSVGRTPPSPRSP